MQVRALASTSFNENHQSQHCVMVSRQGFLRSLERALRALASSSGGTACPGGTRGQPRDRPQESGGDSKAI